MPLMLRGERIGEETKFVISFVRKGIWSLNTPRRHHYVPQFHQRRFADSKGRFWVWDKTTDRIFPSSPDSIAVETDFYRLHELERAGHDPFTMEKQLSEMEGQMSLITDQWLQALRTAEPHQQIAVPQSNREIVSQFIAVQFLRTADTREIVRLVHEEGRPDRPLSDDDVANLHTNLMWNLNVVARITHHIREAIWVFARNDTSTPFLTSDNPIAFRTGDNARWLKAGFLAEGTYAVYPFAPDMVMFCYERGFWKKISSWDCCMSAVRLSEEMVESENSGQVFMAKRFVISSVNDFRSARKFAETIGTDIYARPREGPATR